MKTMIGIYTKVLIHVSNEGIQNITNTAINIQPMIFEIVRITAVCIDCWLGFIFLKKIRDLSKLEHILQLIKTNYTLTLRIVK